MYIGLHVKYPLFSSDINETWFFRQTFEKYPNTKFHENPSSESRVVPEGHDEGSSFFFLEILQTRLKWQQFIAYSFTYKYRKNNLIYRRKKYTKHTL
jgi:hypothetical protein